MVLDVLGGHSTNRATSSGLVQLLLSYTFQLTNVVHSQAVPTVDPAKLKE